MKTVLKPDLDFYAGLPTGTYHEEYECGWRERLALIGILILILTIFCFIGCNSGMEDWHRQREREMKLADPVFYEKTHPKTPITTPPIFVP